MKNQLQPKTVNSTMWDFHNILQS